MFHPKSFRKHREEGYSYKTVKCCQIWTIITCSLCFFLLAALFMYNGSTRGYIADINDLTEDMVGLINKDIRAIERSINTKTFDTKFRTPLVSS